MGWKDTITEEPIQKSSWRDTVEEQPKEMGFGEGLARGTLEALPIAGSIAGGALGAMAGPLGIIGGTGVGAAGGKALEQVGKKLFFNEGPQSLEQAAKEQALEVPVGMMGEIGGQALGKGLQLAGKGISKALPKLGSALTGVSEQEIKTYAQRADQVKELAKASDASTIEAADTIRKQFNTDISSKIKSINGDISKILSESDKKVDPTPIYDALEKYKSNLDPSLWAEEVKQIETLQSKILNSTEGNLISAQKANEIKQFLQDRASTAYRNGDMFAIGKEAANAAKSGAATARELVDQVEPKVTELNSTLKKFHDIEESINPNILKMGAPEASIMGAGTGGNQMNARNLQQLGELTGTPMLEQAQNLAAMRTFSNPPLLPMDVTGKSGARMDFARAGVGAIGGALGGGPIGAAVGTALTSPAMLKAGIEAGRAVAPAVKAITPSTPTRDMLYKGLMQKYFESPSGEVKGEKKHPDSAMIIEKVKGSPYERVLQTAKQNGGDQSLAAANYVLSNRDPEYRKLFGEV